MAWNRSGEEKKEENKSGQWNVRLLLGVASLVVLGAVGVWWLSLDDGAAASSERPCRSGLIKEVKPSAAPKAEEPPPVDPKARPTKVGEKVNGFVMLPNGRIHKMSGTVLTNSIVRGSYAIFDHASENVIAGILTIRPGMTVFGTPHYDSPGFTEDFLQSIKEPIIVRQDDPDDVKELKRAVNEAKADLKAAYDRGENIGEILLRARAEFQDLARYKHDLRKEVYQYADRENVTPEDVETYLQAANKMLESRGIAPLEDTPLTRIKLKMKESWEYEQ